ncbi:MAG: RNA polymerase subunit sigma-70 [Planctomycetaceae bacterium]|nr:RNA polymerase subunit sigma-70 [Planctomycetaceae bacterium]
MLRFAQTLTRNREDAEDALQAAMIRLAQNPKRFGSANHPWPYFMQVLRNETLKLIGKRRPAQALTQQVPLPIEDPADAEFAECRHQIKQAIEHLPPEQAEVVVLKIWEGMTFAEIAVVLKESPNTAASRYRYALSKLSRSLERVAEDLLYE